MKKTFLAYLLVLLCVPAVHAQLPEGLKSFPKGCEPEYIGPKMINLYIAAEQSTAPLAYFEVCSWFGSLRFADVAQDELMLKQLEDRFLPILTTNKGAMQTPNHVDNTVFGVLPLQLYMQTGKEEYRTLGVEFADKQWDLPANPSAADKAFAEKGLSWQTRYWIDDMFMITAIQSQAYLATNDEKYITRAAHEMVAYLDEIQLDNGLFYHEKSAPFLWGRGNGWMAVGMAELLQHLPEKNPNKSRIMEAYKKMMATLKSYRNEEGIWNQLIDEPDVWTETSGSAMFTYAMILGLKNGWLSDAEYTPVVRKAWPALVSYLTPKGQIRNVCIGTNIGYTKQYYIDRQQVTGDRHGQAAMIWCATALFDADNESKALLNALTYDYGTLTPSFDSEITEYTCTTYKGKNLLTPSYEPSYGAAVEGATTVDMTSGTAKATIKVTSPDESKSRTYTINFTQGTTEDLTSLIVNSDFDLALDASCQPVPVVANMYAWSNNAWRPKDACGKFYGWNCDLSLTGNSKSQGINADATNKHGEWVAWLGGDRGSTYTEIEFSQTIAKDKLSAGVYKVEGLLAVGSGDKKNNQRMFVNDQSQYYGSPSDYIGNQVAGELATFAGHSSFDENAMCEMVIYTTITDDEELTFGVRTSNKRGDGAVVAQSSPMFKTDYYRLTKIDPILASDASLAALRIDQGNLTFSPNTTIYNVELPRGTEVVSVVAVPSVEGLPVDYAKWVDVSSGSGVSTIKVTAFDGKTQTYTINFTVPGVSIDTPNFEVSYSVSDGQLTVNGGLLYAVYDVNGMKVAIGDASNPSVYLQPGVYIVKADTVKAFKVVVTQKNSSLL